MLYIQIGNLNKNNLWKFTNFGNTILFNIVINERVFESFHNLVNFLYS